MVCLSINKQIKKERKEKGWQQGDSNMLRITITNFATGNITIKLAFNMYETIACPQWNPVTNGADSVTQFSNSNSSSLKMRPIRWLLRKLNMSERVNTTCLSRIVHSGVNLQASMIERLTETQAGMEQNGASPPQKKKKKVLSLLSMSASLYGKRRGKW